MIRTFHIKIKDIGIWRFYSLTIRFWLNRWCFFRIDHEEYDSIGDKVHINLYRRTVKKDYFFDVVKEIQDNFPNIDFEKINFDLTMFGI